MRNETSTRDDERSLNTNILLFSSEQRAQTFMECLNDLVETYNGFSCNVVVLVDSAVEKLNSLRVDMHVDTYELMQQIQKSKQKLTNTQSKAKTFTAGIKKLFQFADVDKNRAESMKSSFRKGEFSSLHQYVEQIRKYLQQSHRHYKKFLPALKEAESMCQGTAVSCERRRNKARKRKVITRLIGGGVTTAGLGVWIGGGITASILAGLFTCGAGTAIGLGITAIAAGSAITAGAGTVGVASVTSHLVACRFEKMHSTFRDICADFQKLNDQAFVLETCTSKIKETLKSLSDDTENMDSNISKGADYEQFCTVFDMMLKGIRKAQDKITSRYFHKELIDLPLIVQH